MAWRLRFAFAVSALFVSLSFSFGNCLLYDNESVVVYITTQTGYPEIALLNPHDQNSIPRVLTNLRSQTTQPRLSHSRDKIVFSSDYGRKFPILYVIDVDGKNLQPLTPSQEDRIQVAADWSPDDSMLLIEEIDDTGFTRLFIVDAEGQAKLALMENHAGNYNDFFARWCPCGHEILFLSDRSSHHPEFYSFDLEEDDVRNLYLPPIVHYPMANGPAFGPNGDHFIYQEERDANFVSLVSVSMEDENVRELFSVDIVHNSPQNLDLGFSQCVPSPQNDSNLLCCRYVSNDSMKSSLALIDRSGVVTKVLTNQKGSASSPHWR